MADEEIDLDDGPTYHAVPPPSAGDVPGEPEPAEPEVEAPPRQKSAAELRLDAIRKKLVNARRICERFLSLGDAVHRFLRSASIGTHLHALLKRRARATLLLLLRPQGEARSSNHKAVVDEDRKSKMTEKQLRDEERERKRETYKKRVEGAGAEDDSLFSVTAEQAELAVEKAREKRRRAESHTWNIEASTQVLGARLKSEIALEESGAIAAAAGAQSEVDPMSYGTASVYRPPEERVDALVDALAQQAAKRATSSRRRQHYEEDEVTYINDRNKVFNEKIAREFNKYTSEIKLNLERGTAL